MSRRLSFTEQLYAQQAAEAGVNPALPSDPQKVREMIESLKIRRELMLRGKRDQQYREVGDIDLVIFELEDQLEALAKMEANREAHREEMTEAEALADRTARESRMERERSATARLADACPRCLAEQCQCNEGNDRGGTGNRKGYRTQRNKGRLF
jgi:hypothetical protein